MQRTQQQFASCDEDAIAALKRRISNRRLAHLNGVDVALKDGVVHSVRFVRICLVSFVQAMFHLGRRSHGHNSGKQYCLRDIWTCHLVVMLPFRWRGILQGLAVTLNKLTCEIDCRAKPQL